VNTAPCVIEPLVLPSAVGAPDAGDFLQFGALSDALVLETWGNPDRTSPPAARLQTGGLSHDEESWDVARVRHVEGSWKRSGQESLVAAARHRASGELAAYSVLQASAAKPWMANQDDTLVARHHRGRRLGMVVKILNLRRLAAGHPAVERVTTFNAAENDHMLSINVALGFRPAGYDGEWRMTMPSVAQPAPGTGPGPGTQPAPGARISEEDGPA
jgi:hypothetical protein